MAARAQEVAIKRIIACFAAGSTASPVAIARLAAELRADLLGLFIEDTELLRFAALPFAAEVGFPSATRRALDAATVERALRLQAAALRKTLSAALENAAIPWTFRVARALPASAIEAALAEASAPLLLLPPGSDPRAERPVVRRAELDREKLRRLLAASRPVLILSE
jgi:hypothetical protein